MMPVDPMIAVNRLDERKLPAPTPRPYEMRKVSKPCCAQRDRCTPDSVASFPNVSCWNISSKKSTIAGLKTATARNEEIPTPIKASIANFLDGTADDGTSVMRKVRTNAYAAILT